MQHMGYGHPSRNCFSFNGNVNCEYVLITIPNNQAVDQGVSST